ncbi:uncharacterized protein LOC134456946 [Engraulis encrasicolus]|uniref:uncharacterized protein LOC134456946 n=1 Tax=Engraulis encrasicolus TaxID=184585 RepID=UPI002FD163D5
MEKKIAFQNDEDIWTPKEAPKKRARKTTNVLSSSDDTDLDDSTQLSTNKTKQKKRTEAANAVMEGLKVALTRQRSSLEEHPMEDDTSVDMFDQGDGQEAPLEPEGMPDVVAALKELPTLVQAVKDLTATLQQMLPRGFSTDSDSASSSSSTVPEKVSLGSITVDKVCYSRLNRSRMALFAQDLAVLVFGREALGQSSLTGLGREKEALDSPKLNAVIDHVIQEFPGTPVSAVRAVIRRKCNNEHFNRKK